MQDVSSLFYMPHLANSMLLAFVLPLGLGLFLLPKVEWAWSHEALDHVISDERPPLLMFADNILENSNQLTLHLSCQHPTTAILLSKLEDNRSAKCTAHNR